MGTKSLQPSFDDLEPSLQEVTFVVVDLETTGGSAQQDAITEIGAVKVRGGEVLGEFSTLVDPSRPIPAQITLLTGITDAMVAGAPPIASVLPAFLEFARGSVLVAHNAPFDIGFLRAACIRLAHPWPPATVIDTVRLARSVFTRSELPSVRLGVLAAALGARVTPDHRAIHDAQATVDVLHALIERLGPRGAQTLSDLVAAQRAVDPARQRKRHLADGLPAAPGVYLFRDGDDDVLYVGTSGNLRTRVRSYFTAAETRGRIKEMVLIAQKVDYVVCASALEASVREQRLIAAHQPRYNRRSKSPGRLYWVKLISAGRGGAPRLALSSSPPPLDLPRIGPFTARGTAILAIAAARAVGAPEALVDGRSGEILRRLSERMWAESRSGFYQQAAQSRDTLAALAAAFDAQERRSALATILELVAASPDPAGGWELAVVRQGFLASAGRAGRGSDPRAVIDTLIASAATVTIDLSTGLAAPPEETATILTFLEQPQVRIARSSSGWAQPISSAGRWRTFDALAAAARESVERAP